MIKFLFLFIFSSCSLLINSYEKDMLTEKNIKPLDKTEQTYCPIIQKKILINESHNSQEIFQEMIQKITQKQYLSFIDQAVLWSLIQINIRPDQSSPTAKLQFLIKDKQNETYYNVFSQEGKGYPYFYQLDFLLQESKSKHTLLSLAQLYDSYASKGLLVTEGFERFLIQHKNDLMLDENLTKYYIRGDETLKKNEGMPVVSMTKLVKEYYKTKKLIPYEVKNFLFKYKEQTSFIPHCNFDMNLYENSIFLISKKNIQGNIFGMKSGQQAFMAISTQSLDRITPLHNSMVFHGSSEVRSASVCMFKNRFKPNHNLWMISSESRDPGQHLYHLMEYGLNDVKSLNEFDGMLKFSRHLFLKNPVRLVFESKRSDEKQIQELLKLDIPLFNAKKLGKVWSFYNSETESSFLLDARSLGALSCQSN